MRRARVAAVAVLVAGVVVLSAGPASAHPLGNFTTSTAAAITVHRDAVAVLYTLDLAEIPALQAIQGMDADGDRRPDPAEAETWRASQCERLAAGLTLTVGERVLALEPGTASVAFPDGEAGLRTLRLDCWLHAETQRPPVDVRLADDNLLDRVGWREVTATGQGMTLTASDVPTTSLTRQLRAYPEDRLQSPLRQTSAALSARPGGGTEALVLPGVASLPAVDRLTTAFTGLMNAQTLTLTSALLAVAAALVLGGLHAFAPGHGKTVVAACLLGREGTRRQALALGGTIAAAHTVGVIALGVLVTATDALAPERLYPWLGVAGGLLFAAVGATLLRQALRRRGDGHRHDHLDEHDHGHDHSAPPLTWRGFVLPGVAGGLLPSPSALLVLLGGITLGRGWFGTLLVVAYGIGMAATLVGGGYLLVRLRDRVTAPRPGVGWTSRVAGALPVLTASVVVAGGLLIAVRSVAGV